jgi:hypothetical protein
LYFLVSFSRILIHEEFEKITLMGRENLGVVFTPGIIRSSSLDPLTAMTKGDVERGFVENLIDNLTIPDLPYLLKMADAEKWISEGVTLQTRKQTIQTQSSRFFPQTEGTEGIS